MDRERPIFDKYLLPRFGERPVGSLRLVEMQAFVNELAESLAASTVKRTFGVLHAVLRYAVENDYIRKDPTSRVAVPTPEPLDRRIASPDEIRRVAVEVGPEYGPMVYLGAVLGLRFGECAGLRVGRLDLLRSELRVEEQVTRGEKSTPTMGQPKTSAGRRTLSLPEPLCALLAALCKTRGLTGGDTDALLFPAPQGGPLRYNNWRRRVWLPAVESAGVAWLQFHDLRRANATALVLNGVDLKTAQTRLGHADPRMTLGVYARATSASDRAAAQTLGEHFFSVPEQPRAMDAP